VKVLIHNAKGRALFGIDDNGLLYKAEPGGYFLGSRPATTKTVESCGFEEQYTRPNLAGGTTTRFERRDGTTLRMHVAGGGQVWWDTGETLTQPKDIDKVRRQLVPARSPSPSPRGDSPTPAAPAGGGGGE
jgi:hypothetical protein